MLRYAEWLANPNRRPMIGAPNIIVKRKPCNPTI